MVVSEILIAFSYFLVAFGSIFICLSFRSPSIRNSTIRLIRLGEIGVILSLIGGLILIHFFYAPQQVPERILKEHLEEKYVEEPSDISMGYLMFKSEN